MSQDDEKYTKIRIEPKDNESPSETVWATPLPEANTYKIENMCWFCELTVGDIVHATPDATGFRTVDGIVALVPNIVTYIGSADQDRPETETVQRVADALRSHGGGSEGGFGMLATTWPQAMTVNEVKQACAAAVAGTGLDVIGLLTPTARRNALRRSVKVTRRGRPELLPTEATA